MQKIKIILGLFAVSFQLMGKEQFFARSPFDLSVQFSGNYFKELNLKGTFIGRIPKTFKHKELSFSLEGVKGKLSFKNHKNVVQFSLGMDPIIKFEGDSACQMKITGFQIRPRKIDSPLPTWIEEQLFSFIKKIDQRVDNKRQQNKIVQDLNKVLPSVPCLSKGQEFSSVIMKPLSPEKVLEIQNWHLSNIVPQWFNRFGFIRLHPNGVGPEVDNENSVLFTSEYLFLLHKIGVLTGPFKDSLKEKVYSSIDQLRVRDASGKPIPGLFHRLGRGKERIFSRDEQIGLILLDFIFERELGYCKELKEFGDANGWRFDNRNHFSFPKIKRMEGLRLFTFETLVDVCLGQEASPIGREGIYGALFGVTLKRATHLTSGKILAFLRLEVLGQDPQFIPIKSFFYKKLEKMYRSPHFVSKLFEIYFKNPDHPIRKLSQLLKFSKETL